MQPFSKAVMKPFKLLILLAFFISGALPAQDSVRRHELNASLDIYSHHLWRGGSNGTSASLQPAIEYSYGKFTAGAWGAWSIDGSYTELDLYASVSAGDFTLTLFDYFCPENPVRNFEFFEIRQGYTRHTLDLNLSYANPGQHPFGVLVATMLYGDDLNPVTGKNYHSTYIEPSVNFSLRKTSLQLVAGFTPVKSYYADDFAFIHTGLSAKRTFVVTSKVRIPSTLKLIYNPEAEHFLWAIGINI